MVYKNWAIEISLEKRSTQEDRTAIIKQRHQSSHKISEPLMHPNGQRFALYNTRDRTRTNK